VRKVDAEGSVLCEPRGLIERNDHGALQTCAPRLRSCSFREDREQKADHGEIA